MNRDIKAPGEKATDEPVYDYLPSFIGTESRGRTAHAVSTAHIGPDWPSDEGNAYDRLVSFCGELMGGSVKDAAVLTLASNVLTLVHANVQDLQRRIFQILHPIPLSASEYAELLLLAQDVRSAHKSHLVILDHDLAPAPPEPKPVTVHYTPRTPVIPRLPWATQRSFDQYDQDITPFDSEED